MANSLMELYGGGMAGKPTKYQLGGAISSANIRSKYLGDWNKVKEAHADNVKNMGFWSNVGSIGSFLADLIVPGSGGIVKAGAESFYRPQDIGDVDFALGEKEQAQDISDAYRKGIFERGLTSSLSSLLMSDVYKGMGKKVKTGYEEMPQRVADWGADKPMHLGEEGARRFGIGGDEYAKTIMERSKNIDYQPGDFNPFEEEVYFDLLKKPKPSISKTDLVRDLGPDYWMYHKEGGYVPKMQGGGRAGTEYDPTRPQQQQQQLSKQQQQQNPFGGFDASNIFTGFGPDTDWSNVIDWSGWGEGTTWNPNTKGTRQPGSSGTFSPYGDYGKHRDIGGVLEMAGMGDKLSDPEFEKYMKYLPKFDMGYEQQIGDYRTGAQGSLFGMTAPMGPSETTFAGSGAAAKARQTGRKQTTDIYGRQARGVGEQYAKDVLAGLTAAETARKEPFEAPSGDNPNPTSPPISAGEGQEPGLTAVSDGYNWEWNGYSWENRGPVSG